MDGRKGDRQVSWYGNNKARKEGRREGEKRRGRRKEGREEEEWRVGGRKGWRKETRNKGGTNERSTD